MSNGVVAEDGTHEDLVKAKGIYYELLKSQEEVAKRKKRKILNLVKNQKFVLKKSFFSTSPEEAKIRFPEIKRKCFNKLSSRDVEYFVSVLGKDRVISDLTDVEPYNIDFARHIKGLPQQQQQQKILEM